MQREKFTEQQLSQINASNLIKVEGQPLLLHLEHVNTSASDFIKNNKAEIQRLINENGALLIRGLNVRSSREFSNFLAEIFNSPLLKYTYRSTPRTEFRGNIYTATEYPKNQSIAQHNENSYSRSWPHRIGFLCLVPPEKGGETPISCSQKIYELIPDYVKQEFEEKGVMYVRNYLDVDLSWREVFQTDDKSEVVAYCDSHDMTYEWLPTGLRTKQINPASIVHQGTNKKVWFNQAHLFHVSNLDTELAETLLSTVGVENLPRNTYFGDGSKIPVEYLRIIRELYEDTKIKFQWELSDIMLLDNVRFTHGREPFEGERQVIVGMACPNE
ncbi:TauD/TfdA family dioxygenase [Rheinheimera soli]|uniref:Alpha-ketoglutarate-dependent taurine dioxygenase n=1 Tax=Rheinheimera soli TaxID=443616 RepID=A0ABU1W564_9GAMM|nr:TauD/TfdA family dioxygenase [Rheinheimera soli]MDR7123084.1 alpha-ketoglutarate-dependent taurine dioxygenase [Rheinheimera soli]